MESCHGEGVAFTLMVYVKPSGLTSLVDLCCEVELRRAKDLKWQRTYFAKGGGDMPIEVLLAIPVGHAH